MARRRKGFTVAAVAAVAVAIPAVTLSASRSAHGYVASAIQISTSELQQNSLIKAVLAQDIATKPHQKPDALSAGFGFTVVKASIMR